MFVAWFAPVLVFIHFHLGIYIIKHTLNLWDKFSRPFVEKVEYTLAFPSRWRLIDNRNNLYTAIVVHRRKDGTTWILHLLPCVCAMQLSLTVIAVSSCLFFDFIVSDPLLSVGISGPSINSKLSNIILIQDNQLVYGAWRSMSGMSHTVLYLVFF